MQRPLSLSVVEKSQVFKYAEGADPSVDEPIGVMEKTRTLTGKEAEDYIKKINGGVTDAVN